MNIDRAPFDPPDEPATLGKLCAGNALSLVAIVLGLGFLIIAILIGHYEAVLTAGMP
jgi:hypothetical protein